ncbi:hypothetical protein M3Y97_00485900 [Aphelenchoides bicaudatus]|nr:hypothetical protein M3Y97_00485900 [Aphelenchoides bicaudatus]
MSDYSDDEDEIITLNIAGMRYQTREQVLERFPDTLLGDYLKRNKYYNDQTDEYFFDRDRTSFEAILYIYQSHGEVVRPRNVRLANFMQELIFFEINAELMSNFWKNEGFEKSIEVPYPKNIWQRRVWEFIENPNSSLAAKIFALFSVTMIIVSICSFCLETLPEFTTTDTREWQSPFFFVELVCNTWFLLEFLARFLSSPTKSQFFKKILNILDVFAIMPFFIVLIISALTSYENNFSQNFAILRVLRLVQVFRLTRHSIGLQVLLETFKVSRQELTLMSVFLLIGLILFSSGMYFAEQSQPDTGFTSIPGTFWFVMVTTTTVGYGDLTPQSTYGKLIGGICALMGNFTMTFPIAIIVNNFRDCYRQAHRMAALNKQRAIAAKLDNNNGSDISCVEFIRSSKLRSSYAVSSSSDD